MKWLAIKLVRLYQVLISPLLGSNCRFQPTCSEYMIRSIEIHGLWRGMFRGVKRLLKCHPFHPGGWDPP